MNRPTSTGVTLCAVVFVAATAAGWVRSTPGTTVSSHPTASSLPRPPGVASAHNPSSRRLVLHRESLARAQRWERMPLAEFPSAMQSLAGDIDNSDTIFGLLEVWARRHPEGYARFLVEHGTRLVMAKSRHSLDLTGPLMRHLIKENPQAAVDLIDRLAGIGEHNLWSLVASLRLAAPEHMPYLFSRLRDRLSAENPGDGWWVGSDPLTLVSLTHQLKPGPTLTNLLRDGLAHYLERSDADVTQAGTWLAQLPAESQASVIDQLCRAHPREVKSERLRAVAAAMGVPESRLKLRR